MQEPRDRSPDPVQRGYGGGGGYKSNGGVTIGKVLLLSVCAVVVGVMVVNYFLMPNLVSKEDFNKNFQAVTDALTKTKADVTQTVTGLQTTVNALPNTISSQINAAINQTTSTMTNSINSMQTQVNNMASIVKDMASKTDITNLNNTISGLSGKITDLQAKLVVDEATITSLATRITTLETSGASSGGTKKGVLTTAVKSVANTLSLSSTTSTSGVTTTTSHTLTGSVRLAVTNTSNIDVTDALLDVAFAFSPTIPSLSYGGAFTTSLAGGSVPFTAQMIDPGMVEFYNAAWGFKVPANQTVNLFLTLNISYWASRDNNTNPYNPYNWASTYYYQVEADASN